MRILIAEDDFISRTVLERTLSGWGHEVVSVENGDAAWNTLSQSDAPKLAILDWMMPQMDGAEVCRRVRALGGSEPPYLILLTAKQHTESLVDGLDSGANDYIRKPFIRSELNARLRVGERMLALQRDLATRIRELTQAAAKINQLQSMLPICSYCKKVRDDKNYWQQVESYIAAHTDVQFSHGICPSCMESIVLPEMARAGIHLDACELNC